MWVSCSCEKPINLPALPLPLRVYDVFLRQLACAPFRLTCVPLGRQETLQHQDVEDLHGLLQLSARGSCCREEDILLPRWPLTRPADNGPGMLPLTLPPDGAKPFSGRCQAKAKAQARVQAQWTLDRELRTR